MSLPEQEHVIIKVPPSIRLDVLEAVLRRENACIAAEDVAILLTTIYGAAGAEVPSRLLSEAEENNGA